MWLFPGGRIDDTDADPEAPGIRRCRRGGRAQRQAAAREAIEESGVEVDPTARSTVVPLDTSTTAGQALLHRLRGPAVAADVRVTIDDGEIRAHRWGPTRRGDPPPRLGEVALVPADVHHPDAAAPPRLGGSDPRRSADRSDRALRPGRAARRVDRRVPRRQHLRRARRPGGKGEVDLDAPGPRHRLVMGRALVPPAARGAEDDRPVRSRRPRARSQRPRRGPGHAGRRSPCRRRSCASTAVGPATC